MTSSGRRTKRIRRMRRKRVTNGGRRRWIRGRRRKREMSSGRRIRGRSWRNVTCSISKRRYMRRGGGVVQEEHEIEQK